MSRRGDEFERIALPHTRALLRFALRLTHDESSAEDLVQETLLLAWRGFQRFERGSNARAWLFRILVNVHNGRLRSARAAPWNGVLISEFPAASDPSFEGLEVVQALNRLAPEQRTALLLAVVEGFTCREIADILAVPIGTVMSRLSRAREAMRASLSPPARPLGEKVTP
jgi:RNA polymerase sigma-70 factor (ECF subfamily)